MINYSENTQTGRSSIRISGSHSISEVALPELSYIDIYLEPFSRFAVWGSLDLSNANIILGHCSELACPENRTCSLNAQENVSFSAPKDIKIGKRIAFTGNWSVEKVYPQWFELPENGDWAECINKAISFKRIGEVYLPAQTYYVSSPIEVPMGIQLTGEVQKKTDLNEDGTTYDGAKLVAKNWTMGYSTSGARTNFNNDNPIDPGYMIYTNINLPSQIAVDTEKGETLILKDKLNWVKEYPIQGTAVKNIMLSNPMKSGDTQPKKRVDNLKGILCAGTTDIDGVTFYGLKQAVCFTKNYADKKVIQRCTFEYPGDSHTGPVLPAYDLGDLGDAVFFNDNAFHNGVRTDALRVHKCNGGSISNNILNGDVYITDCHGLNISSNHFEGNQTQLHIIDSVVSVRDNFFEKGSVPSIAFDLASWENRHSEETSAILENNSYVFYDGFRPDIDPNDENIDMDAVNQERIAILNNVSEYDVIINDHASVLILQEKRIRIRPSGDSENCLGGIALARKDSGNLVPFNWFNNNSAFYSSRCLIDPGMVITDASPLKTINRNEPLAVDLSEHVRWLANSGKYHYSYATNLSDAASEEFVEVRARKAEDAPHLNRYPLTQFGSGTYFEVRNQNPVGRRFLVYLKRTQYNDFGEFVDTKYLTIPVTGSLLLYDNGISILGYRWKSHLNECVAGVAN